MDSKHKPKKRKDPSQPGTGFAFHIPYQPQVGGNSSLHSPHQPLFGGHLPSLHQPLFGGHLPSLHQPLFGGHLPSLHQPLFGGHLPRPRQHLVTTSLMITTPLADEEESEESMELIEKEKEPTMDALKKARDAARNKAYTNARRIINSNPEKFICLDKTRLADKRKGLTGKTIPIEAIRDYIEHGLTGFEELAGVLGLSAVKKTLKRKRDASANTDEENELKRARSEAAKERWIKRKDGYATNVINANITIHKQEVEKGVAEAKLNVQNAIQAALSEDDIKSLEEIRDKEIEKAKVQIEQFTSDTEGFFLDKIGGPQTIMVQLRGLKDAAGYKRSKTETRIASFTTTLLQYIKNGKEKSPEIQLSLNKSKGPSRSTFSFSISGNKAISNVEINKIFKDEPLYEGYRQSLRPFHVSRREKELEHQLKKFGESMETLRGGARQGLLSQKLPIIGVPLSALVWNDLDQTFSDGTSVYTEENIRELTAKLMTKQVHRSTKSSSTNRKRKSAKRFVNQEEFPGVHSELVGIKAGSLKVSVPANVNNIHAESAILEDLIIKADRTLLLVAGTKVACTACQAYYTNHHYQKQIGNYTSFGWMSKSSMAQLGFQPDHVEGYLLEIKRILEARQKAKELHFYEGSDGTFKDTELDYESDVSDSEDEDAVQNVVRKGVYNSTAQKLLNDLKQNY